MAAENKTGLTYADLFAGIGGMSIPFSDLGCTCAFSFEPNEKARIIYEHNCGKRPAESISKDAADAIPRHDILLAAVPYSPSAAEDGGEGVANVLRVASLLCPRAVLIETDRRLVKHSDGKTLQTMLNRLNDAGYSEKHALLNTSDFGLPHNRERLLLAGFQNSKLAESFDFSFEKKPYSLADILEPDDAVPASAIVPEDLQQRRTGQLRTKRIFTPSVWSIYRAGKVSVLKHACPLRPEAWPSSMLVNGVRKFTPRELLRLQGFPDSWEFPAEWDVRDIWPLAASSPAVPMIRMAAVKIVRLLKEGSSSKAAFWSRWKGRARSGSLFALADPKESGVRPAPERRPEKEAPGMPGRQLPPPQEDRTNTAEKGTAEIAARDVPRTVLAPAKPAGGDAEDGVILMKKEDVFVMPGRPAAEKTAEEAESFQTARREPCIDFDDFQPAFCEVRRMLDAGEAYTRKFGSTMPKLGDFFLLNGQLHRIVGRSGEKFLSDFSIAREAGRQAVLRLHVVCEAGTEIPDLTVPMQKSLCADKTSLLVGFVDRRPACLDQTARKDRGLVYCVESLSEDPALKPFRKDGVLVRFGYTSQKLGDRLANAEIEETFLYAPVKRVVDFECPAIPPEHFEALACSLLGEPLSICLKDPAAGSECRPQGWYAVSPADAVDKCRRLASAVDAFMTFPDMRGGEAVTPAASLNAPQGGTEEKEAAQASMPADRPEAADARQDAGQGTNPPARSQSCWRKPSYTMRQCMDAAPESGRAAFTSFMRAVKSSWPNAEWQAKGKTIRCYCGGTKKAAASMRIGWDGLRVALLVDPENLPPAPDLVLVPSSTNPGFMSFFVPAVRGQAKRASERAMPLFSAAMKITAGMPARRPAIRPQAESGSQQPSARADSGNGKLEPAERKHFARTTRQVVEAYQTMKREVLGMSPDASFRSLASRIVCRPRGAQLPAMTFLVQKSRVLVFLNMDADAVDDPAGVLLRRSGGHKAVGSCAVSVASAVDLQHAMPIVRQAWTVAVKQTA